MTNTPTPLGRSKWTLWAIGVPLAAAGLSGCEFEPYAPSDMEFTMSAANREALENAWGRSVAAGAEAQILGALEMLVGTPQAPRYLLTETVSENFDPNLPTDPDVGELGEDAVNEIIYHNRTRRFEHQLRLIEERRYDEVYEPHWAMDLWERWESEFLPRLLEAPDEAMYDDDPDFGTVHERAVALFEEHYPTLRESAEMYRAQCLHCHGVSGGGNGPTGQYLEPRPRDYRLGLFKWIRVDRNQRPRRADLLNILHDGAARTAMPSFSRFTRGELEGLIDYVRLLSIRGEVETLMVNDTVNSDYGDVPAEAALENYDLIWGRWLKAESEYKHPAGDVPRPTDMGPERIAAGKALFEGDVANCYTCHGENARGDGASSYEDINVEGEDGEVTSVKRRKLNEWGGLYETQTGRLLIDDDEIAPYASNPRNLQLGTYRGGGRPVDLYRRIKYGISGTIMPAADASLTDDDIWNIVYYVYSIAEEHDVARIQERKAAGGDDHHEEEDH